MKTLIEKAAERCRKAHKPFSKKPFKPYLVWCCHHKKRIELLTEPAEHRIAYILTEKEEGERVVRLDNFRPLISIPAELVKACAELAKARAEVAKADAEWAKARAEWDKACAEWVKARAEWDKTPACDRAHRKDVPNHTWNGKSIFNDKEKVR